MHSPSLGRSFRTTWMLGPSAEWRSKPSEPRGKVLTYVEARAQAHGCSQPIVYRYGGREVAGPCKSFLCPECGPKRQAELRCRVWHGVRACPGRPRELTLTAPGTLSDPPRSKAHAQYMSVCFERFRKRSHQRASAQGRRPFQYVKVAEYQRRGALHYHLIVFGEPFVGCASEADRKALLEACGFGHVHSWREVRDRRRLGNYLTKYVAKACEEQLPRYCHRYSTSHNFMPSIESWVALRRLFPEATVEDAAASSVNGELLDYRRQWWLSALWPKLRENREERAELVASRYVCQYGVGLHDPG